MERMSVRTMTAALRAKTAAWRPCVMAGALAAATALAPFHAHGAGGAAAAPGGHAPIPIADILARADRDHDVIERALRRAAAPNPAERLEPQLGAISSTVDEQLRALDAGELEHLPATEVQSLERQWIFESRRFERWQEEMRRATTPYAGHAAALAQRRDEWEATKSAVGAQSLPIALTGRIDATIADLSAAEQALSGPLAQLIQLGQRANAVASRIQTGRNTIAAAITDIDRRLLQINAPPLWALRPASGGWRDELGAIRSGVDNEVRFAETYRVAGMGHRYALGLLQPLLLALLLWLAAAHRQSAATTHAHDAVDRVLARPVSAWLLLGMTAVLVFEPDAPLLAREFARLIALVAALRLLPLPDLKTFKAWTCAASGLYLLDRLALLVMASSYAYRLFQFWLAVVALLLSLWLLWLSHGGAGHGARAARAVRALAWGGIVLLAVSVVANAVGNALLAETLTNGVIDAVYMALLLCSGVHVGAALLQWVLGVRAVAESRIMRAHAQQLLTLSSRALAVAAAAGWLAYTLEGFRILQPTYDAVASLLTHEVGVGEISLSLGRVLVFCVSVLMAFWSARVVRLLLRDDLLDRVSLPHGVGNSIASLAYYGTLLLGLLVALSAAGFKVSQLVLVFGALGVGIGLGLQHLVNNLVSGLVLMFERPFQPGDVIEVSGVSGRARHIGMRSTIVRSFDGADVVVPNGTLVAGTVTNWTLLDRSRRLELVVGAADDSDPAKVLALLDATARQVPGVATDPAPAVLLKDYGDGSLTFVMRIWTQDVDQWATLPGELLLRVRHALAEADIKTPFSHVTLT